MSLAGACHLGALKLLWLAFELVYLLFGIMFSAQFLGVSRLLSEDGHYKPLCTHNAIFFKEISENG